MNKALLLSIVSMIGLIGFSLTAAIMIAPGLSAATPAPLDQLILPGVLILVGLLFAVGFMVNFRAYREGR